MQVDALLTRNMRTPTRAGGISKRTRGRSLRRRYSTVFTSRRVLFLASNPEFYLQRFRLQVVLNMNTHSNPEELSNQRRSAGAKIGDGAETKETDLDVLQRRGTKERKIEKAVGEGSYQARCSNC